MRLTTSDVVITTSEVVNGGTDWEAKARRRGISLYTAWMARGKFIVVEGGDGSGKDTQIEFLQKALAGVQVVYTKEPGGTKLGKTLREILLGQEYQPLAFETEALLFLADRAEHMDKVVEPALAAGKHVISNRSWFSFVAYQIYGRKGQVLEPLVKMAHETIYKGAEPDAVILLDLPVEVTLQRIKDRNKPITSIEAEPKEFHERVRQGFLEVVKSAKGSLIVDGTKSPEEIHAEVMRHLEPILDLA